jgi:LemA protein
MATIVIIIIFLAWVLWHYLSYNSLVAAKNAIDQSWSNTEVELKRRLDLITNLIEVVKGYAKHEGETLLSVISARGGQSFTASAQLATESTAILTQTLGRIVGLVEQYPDLKANNQFLQLQQELVTTENRIAERRHAYNHNVSFYENTRLAIPSNIVAWVHDFKSASYFDVPDDAIKDAVKVSLA